MFIQNLGVKLPTTARYEKLTPVATSANTLTNRRISTNSLYLHWEKSRKKSRRRNVKDSNRFCKKVDKKL
jgi:hypothetical protein